jgi:SagB-type dehydrogenase family enzyme
MEEETKPSIEGLIDSGPLSISEIFHENSKMKRIPLWNSTFRSISSISGDILQEMLTQNFKFYRTTKSINLPPAKKDLSSLTHVLHNRRSHRKFTGEPVDLNDISTLLSLGCGITSKQHIKEKKIYYLRSYPSAGALYPVEIYSAILKGSELDKGLYHYNVRNNKLELLSSLDLKERLMRSISYPEIIENSSLVLILTAIFPRVSIKYSERGYRFALLEGGHLAQNIYLISTALGLGCVSIGGFIDDELNDLVGIDGVNEAVIYTIAIGKIH